MGGCFTAVYGPLPPLALNTRQQMLALTREGLLGMQCRGRCEGGAMEWPASAIYLSLDPVLKHGFVHCEACLFGELFAAMRRQATCQVHRA